jgi:hypothetical protein
MSINLMYRSKPPVSPALIRAIEGFIKIEGNATFRISLPFDTVEVKCSISHHNARMLGGPVERNNVYIL